MVAGTFLSNTVQTVNQKRKLRTTFNSVLAEFEICHVLVFRKLQ